MSPWLNEIKGPCLAPTGELDGLQSPPEPTNCRCLSDSELLILDGLKHAILTEAPDRVASHVLRCLKAHR
jgi:pimeloyl-ACP methyl ester carboxylesterase